MSDLYDEDFVAWTDQQAALLRRRAASAPRACGDEPQLLADPRIMEQCSPRMRG